MKAIVLHDFGGPETMAIGEMPLPEPGRGQLRVRVVATSVNRADTVQRRGHYPPPPGESDILGLEVAGVVDAIGGPREGATLPEHVGPVALAVAVGVACLIGVLLLGVYQAALTGIYSAVLYRYAVSHEVPEAFSGTDIATVFAPKR